MGCGTRFGGRGRQSGRDYPVKDVAAAGGWKTEEVLVTSYQQVDAETIKEDQEGGSIAEQGGGIPAPYSFPEGFLAVCAFSSISKEWISAVDSLACVSASFQAAVPGLFSASLVFPSGDVNIVFPLPEMP